MIYYIIVQHSIDLVMSFSTEILYYLYKLHILRFQSMIFHVIERKVCEECERYEEPIKSSRSTKYTLQKYSNAIFSIKFYFGALRVRAPSHSHRYLFHAFSKDIVCSVVYISNIIFRITHNSSRMFVILLFFDSFVSY